MRNCVTGSTNNQVNNMCGDSDHEISILTLGTKLIGTLHKSLVEIVVQSVGNTTRDVREMQRLSRLLWPLYLNPLLENYKSESPNIDPFLKEVSNILAFKWIYNQ